MSPREAQHYGVAAIGSAGRFTVEILETTDNPNARLMSIEAGGWSLCFALAERGTAQVLSFLRVHAGRVVFSELAIGSFLGAPVILIKDDEFPDRFYLRVFANGHLLEFVLTADALTEFTEAVAQIGPANGIQPIHSETKRTSSADGPPR
jgi:hypothetical protein